MRVPTNRQHLGVAVAGAGGAACGAVVRYLTLVHWHTEVQVLATTLILIAAGLMAWGLVTTSGPLRPLRTFVGGFAGAAGSVGSLAIFAVSASPYRCLAYVVAAPVCAVLGLGVGVLLGLAVRRLQEGT